jgi:hypothetical protein
LEVPGVSLEVTPEDSVGRGANVDCSTL